MDTVHEEQYTFLIMSCSIHHKMRDVSDKICIENKNTHFMFSNFLKKSCRSWDNVGIYSRGRQATDDNMENEHCMLDMLGYKHMQNMQYLFLFYCNNGSTNVPSYTYIACLIGSVTVWTIWMYMWLHIWWSQINRTGGALKVLCGT